MDWLKLVDTYLVQLMTFHLNFTWFSRCSALLNFFFKRWLVNNKLFSLDFHWIPGWHLLQALLLLCSLVFTGETRPIEGFSKGFCPNLCGYFGCFSEADCLANMALCGHTVQGFAQPIPRSSSLEPRAFSKLTSKTTIRRFNTLAIGTLNIKT